MKIILGQGNPGSEYEQTRHNAGFMVLDTYAINHATSFQPKPKFIADIAECIIGTEKVLLVKPSTFYNNTGRSARALLDFYKLTAGDLLVVHDELALPLGTVRLREKGSDAGNNGIKSLNSHVGPAYARIRIGIATDRTLQIGAHDFVLGRFTTDEMVLLENVLLSKIHGCIDGFIRGSHIPTSFTLDQSKLDD